MRRQPIVIRSDNVIYFDVDETLVFWKTEGYKKETIIEVEDPYVKGMIVKLIPHQRNIDLLKRKHGQGRDVFVWSHGGSLWAETVIKALGIGEYVTLIMSKPTSYVDDIPIEEWGLTRVYLTKGFRSHYAHENKKEEK